jgi:hypothetical protein
MKTKQIICSLLLSTMFFTACGSSATTDNQPQAPTTETTETAEVPTTYDADSIKEELSGALSKDDTITNLSIDNKNLLINVELNYSATNGVELPKDTVAESRFSSISDEILDLPIDDLWDTITVDFGEVGHITCDKSYIQTNEYGMRYFENYKLQQ